MSSYEDRIERVARYLSMLNYQGNDIWDDLSGREQTKWRLKARGIVGVFVGDKPLYEIDRNKPEVDDGEFLVEDPDTIGDGWYGVLIQVVPEDE